jgi:integrase
MPKRVPPLSVKTVKSLREGRHAVGGVPGLCLQVSGASRAWILRYSLAGRTRELGLGSASEVTLEGARNDALEARKLLRSGIDPIDDKHERRDELAAGARRALTFAAAAKQYIATHKTGWRNRKHEKQWTSTLKMYAEPTLGALPVDRIDVAHVIKVLEPIWTTKTETATRVRQRIESVLDYCTARGFRKGDNPARWKGHLDNLLAPPAKIAKVEHFAALPWRDMPAFMQRLRAAQGMGARALEFATLTAARSGEVRGATWNEIDLERALWTIPEERMKAGKEHSVPLSAPALKLLRELPQFEGVPYVFPSPRNKALSDMTLTAVLKRMDVAATAHGMRSAFRDWCAESTNYPREVAEMALAHTIGNAVEAAYRRGDLMAKRTRLMRDWAAFLAKPVAIATVTAIDKQARQ